MLLLNLCPHPVNVVRGDGTVISIPFSGQVARVNITRVQAGNVDGMVISTPHLQTIGLNDPKPGILLIVSQQVRLAHPNRADLISPAELIRNKQGTVIGCRSFDANSTYIPMKQVAAFRVAEREA